MIKRIEKSDLAACLEVFHQGYETVAKQFGLTNENCPDRGRANLPLEKLIKEFEDHACMFGYFLGGKVVGFLNLKMDDQGVCKLNDLIILPDYRHQGYGKELLDFCKLKAFELGANRIVLGMIDDNQELKDWYMENDFYNIGYKKFENAPFTVGYMEFLF